MGDNVIRIIIDNNDIGSIDIKEIKYDPETRSITASGKFITDSELVKEVIEGSRPAFSTKALKGMGATDTEVVNQMNISKLRIDSAYCQPFLDQIKEVRRIKIDESPISTLDFVKEYILPESCVSKDFDTDALSIEDLKFQRQIEQHAGELQEAINIAKTEKIEKEILMSKVQEMIEESKPPKDFYWEIIQRAKSVVIRDVEMAMIKYGISLQEAVLVVQEEYSKKYNFKYLLDDKDKTEN